MGHWTKAATVGLFVVIVAAAGLVIYRFVSRPTGSAGRRQ